MSDDVVRAETRDTSSSAPSPCAWRPIASAPRDGTWIVAHARPCGQPFGQARLMLARFGEPGSDGLLGWNNERPNGWRGFDLGHVGPDGSPLGELLDIVPTVWLDPKTRIRSDGATASSG